MLLFPQFIKIFHIAFYVATCPFCPKEMNDCFIDVNCSLFIDLKHFHTQTHNIVRGRKKKNRLEWEKICNKLISSPMCPNGSPLTPLSFFKSGARCNTFIFAQTCARVVNRGKIFKNVNFGHFDWEKDHSRPKKSHLWR